MKQPPKPCKEGVQSFLAKSFTALELLNLLPNLCGRNTLGETPKSNTPLKP
jgi:hypothetical protein